MSDDGPPLRIIHCFRSPVGGVFRHVRDLIEEHVKQGHKVGILCDSSTGGAHEERLFAQIAPMLELGLTRLPIKRSISPGDLPALLKSYNHIKSLRPDILHGHSAKGGALARLIGSLLRANRYRVARLYSPHGGSLHYDRRTVTGLSILTAERLLEPLGDSLVFVCDFERDAYTTKVGKPRKRAERIYNGIHDRDFEIVHPREDAVDFLYIGMLRDLKGPDVFVDAFARTERLVGRPLSALMIGDGPDREKYQNMMLRWGLGRRIAMMPAMRARDAFALTRNVVVPSRAEAMPYIVLEALAARKPVIASRVGGIPEVLGQNSIALAEPGDADSLANVMREAVSDPDWLRKVMPEPQAFKNTFSASTMSSSLLDLYRGILADQAGGKRYAP